jgi:hypothetical protein
MIETERDFTDDNVPCARNGRAGEVRLIMPFLKDRIAGRFV